MVNKFLVPGEGRAVRVRDLFDTVAPRYDLINDLQSLGLHRRWKRRLVGLAEAGPGTRALDLCCGTGDVAFALAGRGAEVVGLDFSEPMLAGARRRQEGSGKQSKERDTRRGRRIHPQFVHGDAQQIPFPDTSFDIVTISYGLRNLADWQGGLREMRRVAKPGARLLVLDFGKPNNALWRALYFGYLRLFVPILGRCFCGDAEAYGYILESLKNYPAQRGVAAAMRELGLADVQVVNLLGGAMSINYGIKK